ncbi:MAG: hypothetical protein ABW178_08160 [Pseudoxanthomonas sp.]
MLTGSLLTAAYLLCGTGAALCFYLATRHQQLRQSLERHARLLRATAWLLCIAGLAAGIGALGPWSGMFAALTVFMLAAVLLPYLDVWRQKPARAHRHVG